MEIISLESAWENFKKYGTRTEYGTEMCIRLKDYRVYLDLSEPAEIREKHVALEDGPSARKMIIKRFRSLGALSIDS